MTTDPATSYISTYKAATASGRASGKTTVERFVERIRSDAFASRQREIRSLYDVYRALEAEHGKDDGRTNAQRRAYAKKKAALPCVTFAALFARSRASTMPGAQQERLKQDLNHRLWNNGKVAVAAIEVDERRRLTAAIAARALGVAQAQFIARHRAERTPSGYGVIDLDHIADVEAVKAAAFEIPHTIAAFASITDGVKVIVQLARLPVGRLDYEAAWSAARDIYAAKLGVDVDESGKDEERCTFYSHDADALYRADAVGLDWEWEPQERPAASEQPQFDDAPPPDDADSEREDAGESGGARGGESSGSTRRGGATDPGAQRGIETALLKIASAKGGETHQALFGQSAVIFGYVKAGRADRERCEAEIRAVYRGDKSPQERDRVIADGYGKATPTGARQGKASKRSLGRPLYADTPDGLLGALAMLGYQFRYNTRAYVPELRNESSPDWTELDDRFEAKLRTQIEAQFAFAHDDSKAWKIGAERWKQHVDALSYDRAVDPLIEWFEALPEWDRRPRLDTLLERCFYIGEGCDIDLARWCSRSPLLGAVQRADKPGSDLQQIPVLVGPQNLGKSAFTRWLLPPHLRERGHDELDFRLDAREIANKALRAIILEWGEMSGVHAAERSRVKSWISRDVDNVRLPYDRRATTIPRRFVVVATSNIDSDGVLPQDTSGYRRYGVVQLAALMESNHAHVRRLLDEEREQLWAEAKHRARNGESARMPDALLGAATDAAKRVAYRDEVAEVRVMRALERCAKVVNEGRRWFRVNDVIEQISYDEAEQGGSGRQRQQTLKQAQVTAVLRNLDALRERGRKVPGGRVYSWWTLDIELPDADLDLCEQCRLPYGDHAPDCTADPAPLEAAPEESR